ncbi:hypothetical protein DPMN_061186 [Dreissena polymorpha]|uniref:Uncharacterized protein n=1 Tax=Dreissena polymorpha TaxID=45954 RepID=A0A9D4HI83_DREPO|nr:hypothetical protein DPMN_061186 [Dreissena polymorpha]
MSWVILSSSDPSQRQSAPPLSNHTIFPPPPYPPQTGPSQILGLRPSISPPPHHPTGISDSISERLSLVSSPVGANSHVTLTSLPSTLPNIQPESSTSEESRTISTLRLPRLRYNFDRSFRLHL